MNNPDHFLSEVKSKFHFASAIIQSVSAIYLLRQALLKKNRLLNLPAYALLFECGRNIIHLLNDSKLPRASKTTVDKDLNW